MTGFRDAVHHLAMPASQQVEYLRSIGTAPSADELALEFDDVKHLCPDDPAAMTLSERIDALLEAMSGPGPVWHTDSLATSAQWAEVRTLAADLLHLLG
ncbi:hypothetical protein UK23_18095 [Lentzea aerocolonigenes]|uniref:Uncharacterized protein n=1 Tax=Lentzea aerocolonigenes TaxID=68170 RepID=A0A0F0GXU1_LENAE|nr:hypothetical protein [Lentzea aerocolonigenes]KJK48095.1 hypothetical protein UK23_18095 [Lentzea aerocolonigenes]